MNEASLQDIETVADGLGEILDQVVFLGGAAVGFYATGSGAPRPRPSLDVDCIVEIHSYGDYGKFEEALRQKASGTTNAKEHHFVDGPIRTSLLM